MEILLASYGYLLQLTLLNAIMAYGAYIMLRTGVFAVPHAGMAAIGAYVAALITVEAKLPFVISLVGAALFSALVALVLALPVVRLRGVYLAIATLAFNEIVRLLAINLDSITRGPYGINGIPSYSQPWLLAVSVLLLAYGFLAVDHSRFGRAMNAIRMDEPVAGAMGVDVARFKMFVFVLGSMITAMGGALLAHASNSISPGDFGFGLQVQLLAIVILGGTGHWAGPIIGAAVLTTLPELLRPLAEMRTFFNGAVIMIIMIYAPTGLSGIGRSLWARRERPSLEVSLVENADVT